MLPPQIITCLCNVHFLYICILGCPSVTGVSEESSSYYTYMPLTFELGLSPRSICMPSIGSTSRLGLFGCPHVLGMDFVGFLSSLSYSSFLQGFIQVHYVACWKPVCHFKQSITAVLLTFNVSAARFDGHLFLALPAPCCGSCRLFRLYVINLPSARRKPRSQRPFWRLEPLKPLAARRKVSAVRAL